MVYDHYVSMSTTYMIGVSSISDYFLIPFLNSDRATPALQDLEKTSCWFCCGHEFLP